MPYLSQITVRSAYESLADFTDGTGKKPIEVTSALRYLIATSAMLKKLGGNTLNLSVSNHLNRAEFIKEVGQVVALSDKIHYTNNFIGDIQSNRDFATGNNFLTTVLKKDRDYPGRPAPIMNINKEQISILPDIQQILDSNYNFAVVKLPFALWLLRETDLKIIGDLDVETLTASINLTLYNKYENYIYNSLKINSSALQSWMISTRIEISTILQLNPSLTNYLQPTQANFSNTSHSYAVISKGFNRIYYGSPGTGKSTKANDLITGYESVVTTFHPDLDYAGFVGSYKPVKESNGITYEFVPKPFALAYIKAWSSKAPVFLLIEEINRGNCAAIFGDIFQLLDRDDKGYSKYFINADADFARFIKENLHSTDYPKRLKEIYKEKRGIDCIDPYEMILIPSNLSIAATMNTSDQSLFPMDSAFKRRWEWEYVPINLDDAYTINIELNEMEWFNWGQFIEEINKRIFDLMKSEDKKLGNRFISSFSEKTIPLSQFKTKVMFYLWNDIYKEEVGTPTTIFKYKNADADVVDFSYGQLFSDESDMIIRGFLEVNSVLMYQTNLLP